MKITCMFCGQEKDASVEHVIPKSIGNNSLTTNNVCKECNDALGATIDDKFVNSFPIKLEREMLGLSGYKGNIPKMLTRGKDSDGNTIVFDKKSGWKYKTEVTETPDGYNIVASSKEEAIKAINERTKRKNISESCKEKMIEKIKNTKLEKRSPSIKMCCSFNASDLEPEFLKIAFEYMNIYYSNLYSQDPVGIHLKEMLNQLKSGNLVNCSPYVNYIDCQQHDKSKYRHLMDIGEVYHLILPDVKDNDKLYIAISLFNNKLCYSVLVSKNASLYPEKSREMIKIHIKQSK